MKIVRDKRGFYRLDPKPSQEELDVFYIEEYNKNPPAPIKKLFIEDKREIGWLEKVVYEEIRQHILSTSMGNTLLDFGKGTGHFSKFMTCNGWKVHEFDYGDELPQDEIFDVIVLLHVLEHLPDPYRTLKNLQLLGHDQTIFVIKVPNDYNILQHAALEKYQCSPWWIRIPDHINYFSIKSLTALLSQLDLMPILVTGDFPMELFLLMGDNYLEDPEIGQKCHERRVSFELSISPSLRQRIYNALTKEGITRNLLVIAKKK